MQLREDPKSSFKCKMCGNCCRCYWDIIITKDDILRWEQIRKNEFLKHIQIHPLSISPAGLSDNKFGASVIEVPGLVENRNESEEFNPVEFEKKLERIVKFVSDNHDYIGEGTTHSTIHSFFSFFFPVNIYFGDVGSNPIFRPKSFTVMLNGLDLGVKYVLSFDSQGQCLFLNDNLCSIHEVKPLACWRFPYDQAGSLRTDERVLDVCRERKSL